MVLHILLIQHFQSMGPSYITTNIDRAILKAVKLPQCSCQRTRLVSCKLELKEALVGDVDVLQHAVGCIVWLQGAWWALSLAPRHDPRGVYNKYTHSPGPTNQLSWWPSSLEWERKISQHQHVLRGWYDMEYGSEFCRSNCSRSIGYLSSPWYTTNQQQG